jgi:hypothetical protein
MQLADLSDEVCEQPPAKRRRWRSGILAEPLLHVKKEDREVVVSKFDETKTNPFTVLKGSSSILCDNIRCSYRLATFYQEALMVSLA